MLVFAAVLLSSAVATTIAENLPLFEYDYNPFIATEGTWGFHEARCDQSKTGAGRRSSYVPITNLTPEQCTLRCTKNPYCVASYLDSAKKCLQFKYCDIVHMDSDTIPDNVDNYGGMGYYEDIYHPEFRHKFTAYPNSSIVHVFPEAVCNGTIITTKNSAKSSYDRIDTGLSVDSCASSCKNTLGCTAFTYTNMGGRSAYFPAKCLLYKTCIPILPVNYDLDDREAKGPLNLGITYIISDQSYIKSNYTGK